MEKFKELSIEEMQEVEGGWALPLIWTGIKWVAGAVAGTAVVEVITDGWETCVNDFNEGYNEVRR